MTNIRILVGDVMGRLGDIPDESIHCAVTSPPYYNLRDYGVDGQLGLEPTIEEYIEKMTAVFEEVRRVLRKDGTLWLNMGDGYASAWPAPSNRRNIVGQPMKDGKRGPHRQSRLSGRLKEKDLIGQPWRLAFALQAAGWWLRSDIIWHKPNPMPESCRDRPTKSHEYVFLMTKRARYFFDAEAVREAADTAGEKHEGRSGGRDGYPGKRGFKQRVDTGSRNARSVWKIPTQPFPEAHFATFPTELPRRCIAAGTSEKGCCPECGAPWVRVIERGPMEADEHAKRLRPDSIKADSRDTRDKGWTQEKGFMPNARYARATTGWNPGCKCGAAPIPCTVLDPFGGAGTTGMVAAKMGRRAILTELNPKYAAMAAARIERECGLLARVRIESDDAKPSE